MGDTSWQMSAHIRQFTVLIGSHHCRIVSPAVIISGMDNRQISMCRSYSINQAKGYILRFPHCRNWEFVQARNYQAHSATAIIQFQLDVLQRLCPLPRSALNTNSRSLGPHQLLPLHMTAECFTYHKYQDSLNRDRPAQALIRLSSRKSSAQATFSEPEVFESRTRQDCKPPLTTTFPRFTCSQTGS